MIAAALAAPWDVRVADDLDEALLRQTAAFLQACLPAGAEPTWSVDAFRWKLGRCNPAGPGFLTCAVAPPLAGSANGVTDSDVVGVTSITAKRLWHRGEVVIGGEIGDTYTHPAWLRRRPSRPGSGQAVGRTDYLSHSIFGRLVIETKARALARGMRLIYGTPNAHSLAGYEKRLQFAAHPCENRAAIRPTIRGVIRRARWSRRLAGPLSAGLRAGEAMLRGGWSLLRAARGYTVEPMRDAAEELDALWDRVKGRQGFSLVRDRAYFQHRFFSHPLAAYQAFRCLRRRQLCGVIVARAMTMPWGKRYGCLVDWSYDVSQPHLLAVMLAEAIRRQDQEGLDGFYLWGGHPRLRAALRLLGFLPVGSSPVIFFKNAEGQAVLAECREMDITLAASDSV